VTDFDAMPPQEMMRTGAVAYENPNTTRWSTRCSVALRAIRLRIGRPPSTALSMARGRALQVRKDAVPCGREVDEVSTDVAIGPERQVDEGVSPGRLARTLRKTLQHLLRAGRHVLGPGAQDLAHALDHGLRGQRREEPRARRLDLDEAHVLSLSIAR